MIAKYIIYFMIMGMIGYLYECTAMTLWLGRWDNRGSLYGPFIPIYGAGALIGTLLFTYVLPDHSPLLVFMIGMCGSALLEYPVHWLIEKYLHTSYWNYSRSPLNLHGRICMPAAVGFGVGVIVIIYGINRILIPWIAGLSDQTAAAIAGIFLVLFVSDIVLSFRSVRGKRNFLDALEERINAGMTALIAKFINESHSFDRYFFFVVDKFSSVFK